MKKLMTLYKMLPRLAGVFTLFFACVHPVRLNATVTISGPTCAIAGTSYSYQTSPFTTSGTMTWTISGGVITGSSSTSATGSPVPAINITWSSGYATGTVTLVYNSGSPVTLTVNLTTALGGGGITGNLSQSTNYNTVPSGTITCPAATGGYCSPSYTYQWQVSTSPNLLNFSNISGATGQNLTITNQLTATSNYRRLVTETNSGNTAYSNTASVTVYPQLTGGSISPAAAAINYNTSPGQLTVNCVTGGNNVYTYQWQQSTNGGSTWANVGANTSTYTPGTLTGASLFQAVTTSNGATATSSASIITVYPQVTTTISPGSTSINYNTSPGTLTNTPGGGTGTYTYQWQSSPDNSTWTNVATTQNYTPGTLTANTYFKVTTTSNGATASATTLVTVYPQVTTSISPGSTSINYNTSPGQLTNSPGGGNSSYTYQWQSSPDNSTWTNVAATQNYTPGSLTANTWFRVTTTSNGVAVTSNTSAITVYPQLNAGSISPASLGINYNTSPGQLTGTAATGGSGTYVYYWYSSPDNSTWTGISGSNTQSYTAGNLTATTFYLRQVTSNGVTLFSNSSAVTVYPLVTTGISPASASINYNTSPGTLTNTPGGGTGTYTYQWQSSPDNATWTNIATTQNYTPGNLTAKTYFKVTTTSNGATASNTCIITVYPQVTTTVTPASASINYNTSPGVLTNTPGGGNGSYTYQWQSSPDNSTWTNIAATQSYTPGNLTAKTYYRVTTTSNGVAVTSNTSVVNVYAQLTTAISPASATVNYNTSPGQLTNTRAGGSGTYTYQWQSAPDGSSWTPISGATAQNYTPGGLTASTYFNVITTSNGVSVTSNSSFITVYPQLQPGTIAPSITLNYRGSGLLYDVSYGGGNGSYTFQWQSSPDSITWANITGAVANSYTVSGIVSSTYYRLNVSSNGATLPTNNAKAVLPLYGGIISSSTATVASGGGATLTSAQSASNDACTTYAYQWQSSTDEINWINISGTSLTGITATTYYRRQAACGADTAYSNTIRIKVAATTALIIPNNATSPAAGTQTAITMPGVYSGVNPANVNYVRTKDFTKPGIIDTATAAAQTGLYDVHQVTQYFDGLGRPIETVAKQATPGQHDFVSTNFYDPFGREVQKYLPYSDPAPLGISGLMPRPSNLHFTIPC